MELRYIKTNRCPVCGCDSVIKESVEKEIGSTKIREHSNGGRWEYRQFACGCEIHYCLNFQNETIKKECPLTPKLVEQKKKREEAKNALNVAIDNLDVDDEYKMRLKSSILYV